MKARRKLLAGLLTALLLVALAVLIVERRSRTRESHCPTCRAGLRSLLSQIPVVNVFVRVRESTSDSACVNTLRQLDGAKQSWALDKGKPADAVPTWRDLAPYFLPGGVEKGTNQLTIPSKPDAAWPEGWMTLSPEATTRYIETNGPLAFCASGGTYEIYSVGDPPTCSLGQCRRGHENPSHVLR